MSNRVALLITNITFAHEAWNRHGAEKDEENMKKLLRDLGYEVVQHRNLTGTVKRQLLKKMCKIYRSDSFFDTLTNNRPSCVCVENRWSCFRFLKTSKTQRHGQRGGGYHVSWWTGESPGSQPLKRGARWVPHRQHLQTLGLREVPRTHWQTKDHHHPGLQRRWFSSVLTAERVEAAGQL